jgi:Predicted branched-chain amino acid permease (azaleucine resistance)
MREALKYSFIKTIPVMCGYLFTGLAFGLLLQNIGYSFIWAFFISLFVYAGSMQYVLVTLLAGSFGLPTVAIMTLLINSRHAFYGLSFIERFKKMGRLYPYMVFPLPMKHIHFCVPLWHRKAIKKNGHIFL